MDRRGMGRIDRLGSTTSEGMLWASSGADSAGWCFDVEVGGLMSWRAEGFCLREAVWRVSGTCMAGSDIVNGREVERDRSVGWSRGE